MEKRLLILGLLIPFYCRAQLPVLPVALSSSSFSPSQLSGMVMWLSITNGLTNTSNVNPPANLDNIRGWADLSGNNNPVSKLGGQNLVYHSSGGPGGFSPCPYLGSSSGGSAALTNQTVGSKSQPNIWFAVMLNPNDNNGIFSDLNSQNDQVLANAGTLSLFNNGTFGGSAGFQNSLWQQVTIGWNGASSFLYTNGVVVIDPTTTGTLAAGNFVLDNFFNLSGSSGSSYTEFIWYSGNNMTSTQRHQVEKYLCQKYGLTYSGP